MEVKKMDDEINESLQELTSELAYIGEKLTDISKCLKKMSNWTGSDEEKYGDKDEDEDEDEDEDDEE
jgi:hypothetical protein